MAEKQIPGDIFYDERNHWFRDINGYVIGDHDFVEQWNERSDEFPNYWENCGIKEQPATNFVLVDDTIKEPKIVETAVTVALPLSHLIAHIDPANADVFDPIKRQFDVWVVRLKGEQTTVGELKCTFDGGVETTASYLISSGAEIDPNTYTKLWKFNISRVNEELASAALRDGSDSTELRQAKNTIAALDSIVKQLERKVNPSKDSQITSLSWQLSDARKTISTQRGELKELRTQLDAARNPEDVATIANLHKEAEDLAKQVMDLQDLNKRQADRISDGTNQLTELRVELRAKANLEKRVTDLTNDLLRTANERDNGVMEKVRARLPEELAKATKEFTEEKSRLKEVEKETDIAHNRETRKLEKKIKKLKGALRAAANDIELVAELKDANIQLTERLSELSIRAARLEAGQDFLASVSIDEEERLSVVEAAGLHSSYDNFPTVHIHVNGGVVQFTSPIISQ